MPILKDGVSPISVRRISRDGAEQIVKKIVLIDANGAEHEIWNDIGSGKHRVTFKSYDGSITYTTTWYRAGETIVKPSNPTRSTTTNAQGEEATYTFSGWATQRNSSSGATGTLTAGTNDIVYYAAFSTVYRKYIIKNGALQSGYGITKETSRGSGFDEPGYQNNSNRLFSINSGIGGYHTLRITNVVTTGYTTLDADITNDTSSGWGIGTTSAYWRDTGKYGFVKSGSGDISSINGTYCVVFFIGYNQNISMSNLYMERTE